jgi:hypothetical protein
MVALQLLKCDRAQETESCPHKYIKHGNKNSCQSEQGSKSLSSKGSKVLLIKIENDLLPVRIKVESLPFFIKVTNTCEIRIKVTKSCSISLKNKLVTIRKRLHNHCHHNQDKNTSVKITINVPLFKKLRDIIFFWWDNFFLVGQSLYEPFRGTF